MEKKKRSPNMIIGFALLFGFLVIALLNSTISTTSVVATKIGIMPGTLFEVRSIPVCGVPTNAFKNGNNVEGQMLTVGRGPGNLTTKVAMSVITWYPVWPTWCAKARL